VNYRGGDMACINTSEIGVQLGITRSGASQTLKRGLRKVYIKIKAWNQYTPTETLLAMSNVLGCDEKELYSTFSMDIQSEIKKYATQRRAKHKTLC
jgi:AraC-like DNA-binding protein